MLLVQEMPHHGMHSLCLFHTSFSVPFLRPQPVRWEILSDYYFNTGPGAQ